MSKQNAFFKKENLLKILSHQLNPMEGRFLLDQLGEETIAQILKNNNFIDILGIGSFSKAYLIIDNQNNMRILKTPRQTATQNQWFMMAQNASKMAMRAKNIYPQAISIPQTICLTPSYTIEESAEGTPTRRSILDTLEPEKQNEIMFTLASFLNKFHQSAIEPRFTPLNEVKRPISEDTWTLLKKTLPLAHFNALQQAENDFNARDTSDEVTTCIHGDLGAPNILYNKRTEHLSLIDFGLAGMGNIYNDFVSIAPHRIGFSWNMMHQLISIYNMLPKKYPVHIDENKVRQMHLYGYLHSFASKIEQNPPVRRKAYLNGYDEEFYIQPSPRPTSIDEMKKLYEPYYGIVSEHIREIPIKRHKGIDLSQGIQHTKIKQ